MPTQAGPARTSTTSSASRPQLNNSIYGIEPGNDGNRLVLRMIKQEPVRPRDFKLVESSEQGMLAEVERAIHEHAADRVPGLGPAPDEHALRSEVSRRRRQRVRPELRRRRRSTRTRARAIRHGMSRTWAACCRTCRSPRSGESRVMDDMLDRHRARRGRRRALAQGQPGRRRAAWLAGRAAPSTDAPRSRRWRMHRQARAGWSFEHWIGDHKIPVGDAVTVAIDTSRLTAAPALRRHLQSPSAAASTA